MAKDPHGLTDKQMRFCEEFLRGFNATAKNFNAATAYIRAPALTQNTQAEVTEDLVNPPSAIPRRVW